MSSVRPQSAVLEQAYRRLEHLYEINKLLASFESVEQTFDPALAVAARTLPLSSAILIETEDSRSKMIVWPAEGQSSDQMRAGKEHVQKAYAYLVGAASTASLGLVEQTGVTALPRPEGAEGAEGSATNRFIVIPLVVAHHQPFGALQLEGARPLDEEDLRFVNAIANQLAIALERDRARRQEITRREHAERERTRFEALAAENSRLYVQAQRAVRLREQVLDVVSHDLKDPLATILMSAATLAKGQAAAAGPSGVAQAAGRIQRASGRMLRLIEDLLDFGSIETGHLAMKPLPQDPGSMVQDTLASFESVAQEKQLDMKLDVEPHLPKAFCDRDRILQVLSNLVANATKVTAKGGHVTLRINARGHELLFAVSNDGPEIDAEDMTHLFEGYWRGKARYKGTGLGLAIARGIVDASGGRIWAESEPGRGATFLFTVPVSRDL
jgi:signal transduction histidine kinase